MQKVFYLASVLLMVFLLTACGSSKTAANTDSTTDDATSVEMSTETRLLIGILKMDGTENEVDATQAAELLPLWQLYQSLSTSDTAAQEEIDAVIHQIEKILDAEQLTAIDAMDLSSQNMRSIMQDLGLVPIAPVDASGTPMPGTMPENFNNGEPQWDFSSGTPPSGGFSGGQPPEGFSGSQRPGGGNGQGFGPGGEQGLGPGDGTGMSQDAIATAQASGGRMPARSMRVSTFMLNAIIEYLQEEAEQ